MAAEVKQSLLAELLARSGSTDEIQCRAILEACAYDVEVCGAKADEERTKKDPGPMQSRRQALLFSSADFRLG